MNWYEPNKNKILLDKLSNFLIENRISVNMYDTETTSVYCKFFNKEKFLDEVYELITKFLYINELKISFSINVIIKVENGYATDPVMIITIK
jgi:hypothetical protein